jgi:polyphosphate kinase
MTETETSQSKQIQGQESAPQEKKAAVRSRRKKPAADKITPKDGTDALHGGNIGSAGAELTLSDPSLYVNREISWIEFDRKVLETAMDPEIPLLNRVLFLSIFFNNLDEFYMVRVMNLQRQARSGAEPTGPDKIPAAKQLVEIRRRVADLVAEAEELWLGVLKPELEKKGIRFGSYARLSPKQREWLDQYFDEDIFPILTPQAVDAGHPFPMISNTSINFVIELTENEKNSEKIHFARLKCPNNVPRFLFISEKEERAFPPMDGHCSEGTVIMVEDLIANRLCSLFPGYTVKNSGLFRIIRNTDGEIEEDEADDLLSAVRDYVEQRRFGSVVRLELERGMPQLLQDFLIHHLDLNQSQVVRYRVPLSFSDFASLMKLDRPSLKYPDFHSKIPKEFDHEHNVFDEIRKRDLMVFQPYDSFGSVLEFLRQAALDPNVVAIKQTLYRCGKDSPIVKYLLDARRRGKQVTAIVELKARFDEEQNINWAEELERNGVNVVYGFAGLKIHAKLCFVVRREPKGLRRYVHIGTGNYNAVSAKIYTDLGLFSSNKDICDDIQNLFNVMTGFGFIRHYKKLLVSPHSTRPGVLKLIEDEIESHKKNGGGHIIVKCNQLVDAEMIEALYKASRCGVKVECIVRGICSLRPGVPGVSETITVRSIVGRFLEHARIYYFHNAGDAKIYFGSADLMPRNLNGRIEVLAPIISPALKENVMKQIVLPQLKDNIHAWVMRLDGSYVKQFPAKGAAVLDSQALMMTSINLNAKS